VQNKDLTVIVPALNEERMLKACLDSVKKLDPLEIIVVDGGSSDRTREIAGDTGALVVHSPKGRGIQMNKGASLARGEILLFLHADAKMPEVKESLSSSLFNGCVGGFFKLKFSDDSIATRLVEMFANTRARLLSLPYGDQAIFIKRDIFERVGGFREYPFLEDIDMAMRLRKIGKLKYLPFHVTASSRRLKKDFPFSPILVSFRNVFIALLFLLGLSPFRLIRLYK
jgi:rSAM/selenodomain-associated transferase 2